MAKPSGDPWLLYRNEVSAELREEIRDQLLAAKVNGFEDFLEVSMAIVARVLCGDIHPEIAKETRSYLELCLTAVTAKAMKDNGAKGGTAITADRLARAHKARKALPSPHVVVEMDMTKDNEYAASWEDSND